MLRFLANLSMLFGEYDFPARFEKATQCGFHSVELVLPYDYDIKELKQVLASNKLEHMLHNLLAGDWVVDERGIACISGCEEEFRDGVTAATRYARAPGSRKINCLAGKAPTDFSGEQIHTTLIENLRYTTNMLMRKDILLLTELTSHFDIPGFHLTGVQQTLKLIDNAGCCNLKIQYDIYHMQRMEGELTNTVIQRADKIDRLRTVGNPHHDKPGTGEINYGYLPTVIENSDYNGWVGCRYKPQTATEAGLRWIDPYR